jgi:hypothetical protein
MFYEPASGPAQTYSFYVVVRFLCYQRRFFLSGGALQSKQSIKNKLGQGLLKPQLDPLFSPHFIKMGLSTVSCGIIFFVKNAKKNSPPPPFFRFRKCQIKDSIALLFKSFCTAIFGGNILRCF